eukprot:370658-Prorocentrum_minimum.AAC.1
MEKYQLTNLEYECTVYSFGVANDYRFELGLNKHTNCTVLAFEPSTKYLQSVSRDLRQRQAARVHLSYLGLGGAHKPAQAADRQDGAGNFLKEVYGDTLSGACENQSHEGR